MFGPSHPDELFIHRIDDRNRIVFANAAWWQFAQANGATGLRPESVLGRSLFDFIHGESTRDVLELILERARTGRANRFAYRCDTPGLRRYMEATVHSTKAGEVEFVNRIVRVEIDERGLAPNLTANPPALLRVCSWCKRIELPDGRWDDIGTGAARLELFHANHGRPISHGICDDCLATIL